MTETPSLHAVGPIGQISRRVPEIEAAVRWYRDILGLTHLSTYGDLAFFDAGGIRLVLTATDEGAGPSGESSSTSASRTSTGPIGRCRLAASRSPTRRI